MQKTMAKPRTDRLTSAKVEKGLAVQRTASTEAAAQYMAANEVPLHVAVRVLTTSRKRDMGDLLRAPPSWHDIIRSSGATFGVPLEMRKSADMQ